MEDYSGLSRVMGIYFLEMRDTYPLIAYSIVYSFWLESYIGLNDMPIISFRKKCSFHKAAKS